MSQLRVKTVTVTDPAHLELELNNLRDLNAPATVVSVSHSVEPVEGAAGRWTVLVVLDISDEAAMEENRAARDDDEA